MGSSLLDLKDVFAERTDVQNDVDVARSCVLLAVVQQPFRIIEPVALVCDLSDTRLQLGAALRVSRGGESQLKFLDGAGELAALFVDLRAGLPDLLLKLFLMALVLAGLAYPATPSSSRRLAIDVAAIQPLGGGASGSCRCWPLRL